VPGVLDALSSQARFCPGIRTASRSVRAAIDACGEPLPASGTLEGLPARADAVLLAGRSAALATQACPGRKRPRSGLLGLAAGLSCRNPGRLEDHPRLWPAPAALKAEVIEGWICWWLDELTGGARSTSAHPRAESRPMARLRAFNTMAYKRFQIDRDRQGWFQFGERERGRQGSASC